MFFENILIDRSSGWQVNKNKFKALRKEDVKVIHERESNKTEFVTSDVMKVKNRMNRQKDTRKVVSVVNNSHGSKFGVLGDIDEDQNIADSSNVNNENQEDFEKIENGEKWSQSI